MLNRLTPEFLGPSMGQYCGLADTVSLLYARTNLSKCLLNTRGTFVVSLRVGQINIACIQPMHIALTHLKICFVCFITPFIKLTACYYGLMLPWSVAVHSVLIKQ